LGFADRDQAAQDMQVSLTPQADETASDADQASASSDADAVAHAESTASGSGQASEATTASASGEAHEPDGQETDRTFRVSKYAALLARRPPMKGLSTTVKLHNVPPISDEPLDAQQREYDRVVDNFIAYDVGKLRGSAGRQARQQFAELGPESVPALVRGLNRAAGIHASCPVGVIASKLIMTLRASSDPSLRQYAVEHLGAGVPEDAPHYNRILALRNSWLDAPGMPANVAQIVERLESRQEGELMELMLALSEAPSDTLIAALRSGDEYLAAAASLAIVQSPNSWDSQQRGQLRAALVQLRMQAANPQVRTLANDAANVVR
jgi:hypothetical protein